MHMRINNILTILDIFREQTHRKNKKNNFKYFLQTKTKHKKKKSSCRKKINAFSCSFLTKQIDLVPYMNNNTSAIAFVRVCWNYIEKKTTINWMNQEMKCTKIAIKRSNIRSKIIFSPISNKIYMLTYTYLGDVSISIHSTF